MAGKIRRSVWLAARRARGLKRPLPFDIMPGNLMGVSTGPSHSGRILSAYLSRDADAYLLSECADLWLPSRVRSPWRAIQFGERGSAKSGTAVVFDASRVTVRKRILKRGSKQTSEGGGIRDRYLAGAKVTIDAGTPYRWNTRLLAGHAAPDRAPKAQAAFMKVMFRALGIRAGDTNRRKDELRKQSDDRVHGSGVLSALVPKWIDSRVTEEVSGRALAGADHGSMRITLWPHKPRKPRKPRR